MSDNPDNRWAPDEFRPSVHQVRDSTDECLEGNERRGNPNDFSINKGLPNLPHLRELEHQVNRKLLEVERVSHQCVLTQDGLDRLQSPTVEAGQRVSALRFGDPRVMALLQAITGFTHLPRGFRNRDLRPLIEGLLGRCYTSAQMTYDLPAPRITAITHSRTIFCDARCRDMTPLRRTRGGSA